MMDDLLNSTSILGLGAGFMWQRMMLAKAGQGGGYIINQSIRFNDDDSAYMHRTPGSAGNAYIFTKSVWVKRHNLGTEQYIASVPNGANSDMMRFNSSNQIRWMVNETYSIITDSVYRDVGAWMHILFRYDSTNQVWEVWVNGEEVSYGTHETLPLNYATKFNDTVTQRIGCQYSVTNFADMSMAEHIHVDGAYLDASDFGEFDANGVWVPISPSVTYGTNGFHQDYAVAPGTGNGAGTDVSGNGNHFTDSGLTSADQMLDSPTDDAANDVGNYATLNPLALWAGTLANGNLLCNGTTQASGTMAPTSGKWYFEVNTSVSTNEAYIALVPTDSEMMKGTVTGNPTTRSYYAFYSNDGKFYAEGTGSSVYSTWGASSEIVMVAWDADTGEIWVGENNTWHNSGDPAAGTGEVATASAANMPLTPYYRANGTTIAEFNFGAGGFTYTPPTGFKALCTANLPAPAIADGSAHFQTTLYTGNGTAIGSGGLEVNQSGNSTFQPDFVWIKNRDAADQHILTDVVRGATKYLSSDGTDTEVTATETLSTFDADGFTVGSDVQVNTNTEDYVAWQWLADNTSGSSNTDGTITSTVAVNDTAGFSIATYTGSGSNATIGHGLSAAPNLIMVKKRTDDATSWKVYHSANTAAPETDYLVLDTTAATADLNTIWNDTAPTSSVFSIGTHTDVNDSGATDTYVAYCFRAIEGYSAFGSYTGNGSTDGPVINCGFAPTFVMWKGSDVVSDWTTKTYDIDTANPNNPRIHPSHAAAEHANDYIIDFLSNGFKQRDSQANGNQSGKTYIYAAFAEHPFGGSGVAQARAR